MPILQVDADLPPNKLIEAVKQLSPTELDDFINKVMLIHAQRKTPRLSHEESDLLQKINEGIPESIWQRYQALVQLREAEQLTEEYHEELVRLSNLIEERNADRIKHLSELAQIRNQSLRDVMADLGIEPPDYA